MPLLTKQDIVWTLDLGADENRFHPDWLAEADAALDEIAGATDPAVLLTIGEGKFFTNGLDLDWLGEHPDQLGSYVDRIHGLFSKVLTLPVPTVAALNGHAFGGGAMLALAHDFRVMREDRGYFCLPEVDIQIPFTPGMSALVTAKLTPASAVEAMTTGRRYSGPDALERGIVDAVAPLERLQERAAARVAGLAGKDRRTLGTIKSTMYAATVEALAPQS